MIAKLFTARNKKRTKNTQNGTAGTTGTLTLALVEKNANKKYGFDDKQNWTFFERGKCREEITSSVRRRAKCEV